MSDLIVGLLIGQVIGFLAAVLFYQRRPKERKGKRQGQLKQSDDHQDG